MPTVVDSLILTLGLDPSDFTKGQKQAAESFAKTKDEALKTGKTIEDAGAKGADAIAKISREALGLFAILLGGRGLKEFVADVTASNAALGRLGVNLSASPQAISAWGAAAERMGGNADATAQSFQAMSDKIQALKTRGEALPMVFYQIQAMGGRTIDLNHGINQTMVDLAENLKRIGATDPAKANFLGRQLGIDPDTVNLMMRYGGSISAVVSQLERLAPRPEDIKASQELQAAWAELSQEFKAAGTHILTDLIPPMKELAREIKPLAETLEKIATWEVPEWLRGPSHVAPDGSNTLTWLGEKIVRGAAGIMGIHENQSGSNSRSGEPANPYGSIPGLPAGRSAGTGSGAQSAAMDAAMSQLAAEGVPEANRRAAAAVMVGQAVAESGLNPNTVHDSGTGYGIYGARLERRDRMLQWLVANGYAQNSLEGQMKYMVHEAMTNPAYRQTRDALMTASESNMPSAEMIARQNFESPSIWRDQQRLAAAQSAFAQTGLAARNANASGSVSNDNRSSTSETHIGTINVNAPNATDANGVAQEMWPAIMRYSFTNQANTGPQ